MVSRTISSGFADDMEMCEVPGHGINGWHLSYLGDEWDMNMPENCSTGHIKTPYFAFPVCESKGLVE